MRTDLLIVWPVRGEGRAPGGAPSEGAVIQKAVVECKVLHGSLERTVDQGLEQIRAYMDRCATPEGHLVVFDRTPGASWDDKVFRRERAAGGLPVTVWGR